jgi:hypothetical protein
MDPQLDPQLYHHFSNSANDIPLDPALFDLERVVEDARRGKYDLEPEHHVDGDEGEHRVEDDVEVEEMDDEIDPALREIVNSLTNAQQVRLVPPDTLKTDCLRLELAGTPLYAWNDTCSSCCGNQCITERAS